MKKVWKLICRVVAIVLVSLFIGYDAYLFNATYICQQDMPMPLGVGHAVIMSGSMEPTISVMDVVVVKKKSEYQIGDIITFQSGEVLVTHRIISKDGNTFTTQGDANNAPDPAITEEVIYGSVTKIIPKIGIFLLFLQKPIGMLCIFLALLICMELSFRRTQKDKKKRVALVRSELEQLKVELEEAERELEEKKQKEKKETVKKQNSNLKISIPQEELVIRVKDGFWPDSIFRMEQEKEKEEYRRLEEERIRKEAEERLRIEEEARKRREKEERIRKEIEEQKQREEEERIHKEALARLAREENERRKREEEERIRREAIERKRKEEEEQLRKELELRMKLEEEERKKAEIEEKIQLEMERIRQEREESKPRIPEKEISIADRKPAEPVIATPVNLLDEDWKQITQNKKKQLIQKMKQRRTFLFLFGMVWVCCLISLIGIVKGAKKEPFQVLGRTIVWMPDDSMEPILEEGDVITLKSSAFYQTGDVIAYPYHGRTVVHRIVETNENGIVTKGDAMPDVDPTFLFSNVVIGRVTKINGFRGILIRIWTSPITLILLFALAVCGLYWVLKHSKKASDSSQY